VVAVRPPALGLVIVGWVKYCCEYACGCPERVAVGCYVHGGEDLCCLDEGKVRAGTVLRTAGGEAVNVLGIELCGGGDGRFTLIVDRAGVPPLAAGAVLTS
jgi:hypothetical protein